MGTTSKQEMYGENAADLLADNDEPPVAIIRTKMDELMTRLRGRIKVVTQGGKPDLIEKFYKEADKNGDGFIDHKELQQIIWKQLKFTKYDFTEVQIKELFAVLDDDDNGEIDLDE